MGHASRAIVDADPQLAHELPGGRGTCCSPRARRATCPPSAAPTTSMDTTRASVCARNWDCDGWRATIRCTAAPCCAYAPTPRRPRHRHDMPRPTRPHPGRRSRPTVTQPASTGVGAMVLAADCLPVALGNDGAVAMVHAGWRGLAAGVLEEGVRAVRELGGEGKIAAIVGPGAGPCCYEVGPRSTRRLRPRPVARARTRSSPARQQAWRTPAGRRSI